MSRALLAPAALFLLALPSGVHSQASTAPYTLGSVWTMNFQRVKPGLGDDSLNRCAVLAERRLSQARPRGETFRQPGERRLQQLECALRSARQRRRQGDANEVQRGSERYRVRGVIKASISSGGAWIRPCGQVNGT